jgi:hypothetical protein
MQKQRAMGILAVSVALLLAISTGCGESTPQGRELASPAEQEAAPTKPEALDMTREQRREELRESFGVEREEPGREAPGYDSDLAEER